MEQKTVQIDYQGKTYDLVIRVEYVGIDSHITAQLGETRLMFEANPSAGIDIITQGPDLEEGLINEITRTIIVELDNWTIGDKRK
jgi:hypothetical protein